MTARGLRTTIGIMSRTARLKTPCVESGTHPVQLIDNAAADEQALLPPLREQPLHAMITKEFKVLST